MTRLEILEESLRKKKDLLNEKINDLFSAVAETNGQPLNDKKDFRKNVKRFNKKNNYIIRQEDEIEKTVRAIEKEKMLLKNIESSRNKLPSPVIELIEKKIITQWRRFPDHFFVVGVEKARIILRDNNKLYFKYTENIPNENQRIIFNKVFNDLQKKLSLLNITNEKDE